jgi:CRP/FNR family transcriptional regulator, cyclic AMP receptor protein
LIEAIEQQPFVRHDRGFAERLADVAELKRWSPGERIIVQDAPDRDLFLILAGGVSIEINGRELAARTAGQYVGEMALIDPHARRSATVVAKQETVTARISEPAFSEIAAKYSFAWRCIASELAGRLRQRTRYVRARNEIPVLFIGSSTESLGIAQSLDRSFGADRVSTRPWTTGVFGASTFPIEDLEALLDASDFAALIVGADDLVESRGKTYFAPRDNVVLEIGLFMGALQHKRTFIVAEKGLDLKLPSDLVGLGLASYPAGDPASISDRILAATDAIRTRIRQLGPI